MVKEVETVDGFFYFKLGKLLKENNISINRLMRDTETDFKVIKRLISGDATRIDIYVLGRICKYLNCSIEDIIYFSKEKIGNFKEKVVTF